MTEDTANTPLKSQYSDLREQGAFTTRYYFTTNALPIKKKENYALIHLYGPEVHFAVTDNLSLGVMATWIASPIALAAKYSFDSNSNVHFSVGSIVGSGGYLMPEAFGGLHFLTLTKGDRKSNVSFSAGYAHVNLGSTKSYGPKYSYQSYDSNGEYHVPYGYVNDLGYESLRTTSSNNSSFVFGLSGIVPVGKKASFIFDSMLFLTQKSSVVYTDINIPFTLTESTWDYSTSPAVETTTITTNTYTIGEGSLVNDGMKPTIVLMPAMRFNQSHGRAIQVALSGVIYQRSNGTFQGFPVPMVSWLRQF